MTTNEKIIPLVCLIVGLAGGFFWGSSREKLAASKDLANYQSFIKARFASISVLPPQTAEVKQLSGSIKSVHGQTFVVAVQFPRDLFSDPALDERNVTVDTTTKVVLLSQKDPKVFQAEIDAFQSALRLPEQNTALAPPQMFDKKDSDRSALKVGQMITVSSAENVKDQKSFVAATIEVAPTAPTPSPVTP